MSRDETLAFWIAAPGRGELRREALPSPGAAQASVRTLYSGVSRGTEAIVFSGHVPERSTCACGHRSRPGSSRRR